MNTTDRAAPGVWISVNDRLPKYPSTVLAAYESDADGEPCIDTGEAILYPDGKWYGMGVFYALGQEPRYEPRMTEKKVRYWQPLPKYATTPQTDGATVALTYDRIAEIADDNDSGRTTSGRRLFSERNLLAFARTLLAATHAPAMAERFIYDDVCDERLRQDAQWGGDAHDDTHADGDWMDYIWHQMYRWREESKSNDPLAAPRQRFVKIAALAVAAMAAIDRRVAAASGGEQGS